MFLEKLFLNVLIVLAPVLVYTAFGDRWQHFKSPYVIGLLYGISSSLCLIFSYYALDLYWDLRYVPLVISTMYGGPLAGFINYLMILATRTYLGGNAILFGYISITLAFLVPLLFAKKIGRLTGRRRIRAVILVSVIPSIVMLLILISFTLLKQVEKPLDFEPIRAILFFGLIQTIGTWLSCTLQEFNFERAIMKEEIQRAEKLKILGEVAASIAHEIRNPLTVVQGFLQLMSATIVEGKNRIFLQFALDEIARAEAIINDYLNFSKPKLTKYEKFSLSDLIENITSLLTPLASYKGIQFDSGVEEQIYVHTDRGQLQQALVNVIKNAVEASMEKAVVQIKLELKDDQAEIKIIDKGKGMTPDEIQRIGTLFYTTKESGTGLGTSVAVRIIEAMKGRIIYESEKGIGTVCTISLPLELQNSL
ncbi:HAMP domain-containing sensor histidine kinase [Paenibacillus sp. GP183]|uniref:sensor histidine kinase n=1 Tax=Paenibacillus sp. GP183 TaxID=1882751 RepID=UPI0008976B1C|nr:HAMP domain-containing sensor histidine kinase [Paenibacillus sp. GP183]SEB91837.1 two-component system, sporulation sensor kinase B [Paenibacillus sp. GP183]